MKNTIYIWKPVGFTPLEIAEKFKEKNQEYKDKTVSYAGRLDPMAEGILVLLIGEENKNRDEYLKLKKTYEAEIVFGISTDTFDSLGLIENVNLKEVSKEEIEKGLETFSGKQKQLYPPYSSKAVNGKSLFWWARNNKLNEIEIPERDIEIYSIDLVIFESISLEKLVNRIVENIKSVKGDFRQKEIIEKWENLNKTNRNKNLIKIKIKVSCSTGTYVRRLAQDLGEKLEAGAFALSITRTGVGDITREDCLSL